MSVQHGSSEPLDPTTEAMPEASNDNEADTPNHGSSNRPASEECANSLDFPIVSALDTVLPRWPEGRAPNLALIHTEASGFRSEGKARPPHSNVSRGFWSDITCISNSKTPFEGWPVLGDEYDWSLPSSFGVINIPFVDESVKNSGWSEPTYAPSHNNWLGPNHFPVNGVSLISTPGKPITPLNTVQRVPLLENSYTALEFWNSAREPSLSDMAIHVAAKLGQPSNEVLVGSVCRNLVRRKNSPWSLYNRRVSTS